MPPVQTARINIHDALDTEPNAPNFRWKNQQSRRHNTGRKQSDVPLDSYAQNE